MSDYKQPFLASTEQDKQSWVQWLETYGADKFYDVFLSNAQGAQSTCVNCKQPIFLDIVVGGGVTDWGTEDGDFGCPDSPDTGDDGCGDHQPERANQ